MHMKTKPGAASVPRHIYDTDSILFVKLAQGVGVLNIILS